MIRDATAGDLAAIVDIYNAAIPSRMSTADLDPVTPDGRRNWFEGHSAERRPIWVLEWEGAVVAWLSFQSFYGRPGYDPTAEVSVYVAPGHRRRAFGRRLLAEAIRRAPDFGLATLLAFVFAHNAPSLGLFEGLGFERWGGLPRVASLDGVERDLVILGRRVDQEGPPLPAEA